MEGEGVTLLTEKQQQSMGGSKIRTADEVANILCLHQQGWGTRRISQALGISRNTVKKYLQQGERKVFQAPARETKLSGLEEWLRERLQQHHGNADVVRQELRKEKGIDVSLRTVERAVQPWRRQMQVEAEATVRYETAPGRQMQIDFGEKKVLIADEWVKIHLFTATLGYSRRQYVRAFRNETQTAWFEGIEGALRYFGGIPEEVLVDNAKALVSYHNGSSGELKLNEKFKALAAYWGFRIKACVPNRPRTKGKVERYVGYGKNNGLAGRKFGSVEELESHIAQWMREIADQHVVSTTGETPRARFEREERGALRPLRDKAPFQQIREYTRKVARDATVELDTNHYSVPWSHIGEQVRVQVENEEVVIRLLPEGKEIARHARNQERCQRVIQSGHLEGIVRDGQKRQEGYGQVSVESQGEKSEQADLSRPLSKYEEAVNAA